ncbi:hypothetical protein CP10139811_0817 [Chlamydia ibidis]|uniref:Uncharacterized protein n=2 Tax=Chlamydia ibidis TaxID=1405396 RepID=S7J3M7_9CHLA|nr:hypothetical protein [Chlamydia ibidis]EPP34808.1 hypothetical protein CP10139811_0817 [Chlamydia ibidis]EQM62863.1 hypothetical protein H359_0136 [Chlamydia ibidis 10-1398/6]
MMLDLRFSTDYYLRVLELAIRDNSRRLVYNKKLSLLEAWPIHKKLSKDQDESLVVLQRAIEELFSRSSISYAVSGRLLSIIDACLRQVMKQTHLFHKIFFYRSYLVNHSIVKKLLSLKNIIFLESQRPLNKIYSVASKTFKKKQNNFSCWEDFAHNVDIHDKSIDLGETVKEQLISEASSQVLMDALMIFLENQDQYFPLTLELLDQFLSEKSLPLHTLSESNYVFLSRVRDLYLLNNEDFQAVVGGIITESFQDILDNSLLGNQWISQHGRETIKEWRTIEQDHYQDSLLIQGFLSEVVRHVVIEHIRKLIKSTSDATPEQIGHMYSIRDRNPKLWVKMMRILFMRWLLDFDDEVHSNLKKKIQQYTPNPSFWQQLQHIFKKI